MISTEDILTITENVFTTMIDSPVELDNDESDLAAHAPITGCVQIAGEWSGAVLVQTTGDFATQAASKMLMLDQAEVCIEDRQDTMAEIANMIGGNIKSLVPGPSTLSLPTVTTGEDFDIRIFGTTVENSVAMTANGQQLKVIVCRGCE
ncbi:chemotaxis protein CheX [Rhodopirellula europaea]|uniref:Inhibitor of MCP methylation CheC-like protein n=1 Tax=Rhodopirellula europaea 6C TaxID=1263867 RepID=M2AR01_9BACT|nr:chemotaxis protein CheX [Rhodopirellula europaea]EMB15162.1 inhibitor of MCP methylation CheC-like protein [Rhodopirellula europaea 6C]